MEKTSIQRKAQVVLGPTMSQAQNALMQYEAGTRTVENLYQNLKDKVEMATKPIPAEILEAELEFINDVEGCCKKLEKRGVQIDRAPFDELIIGAIHSARQAEQGHRIIQFESIHNNVREMVTHQNVIRPKFTSLSSTTGRIHASQPAIQNWPSALRRTLKSTDASMKHTYSLDFTAFDPTVLAALSQDQNLITDLKKDDFYLNLLAVMSINPLGDKDYRSSVKQLFLASFINGAEAEIFIRRKRLPISKEDWQAVIDRYSTAQAYIETVNAEHRATGMNGIELKFRHNDEAVFSKFIQAQAAYIFKKILLDVQYNEWYGTYEVLLPVHDALIIGTKTEEEVHSVTQNMSDIFNEITSTDIARVKIEKLSMGQDDDHENMEK